MKVRLADLLPASQWLAGYHRGLLRRDAAAGITTAVMLIPQAMAYALLAGLPPAMGLYAAIAPVIVYALFGTSRQLAVGPAAIDSLLTAASVSVLASFGSAEYVSYAILLALLVGSLQLLMGIFRFGFLVNFLSQPVITGFTAAAALVIAFSQLDPLLGLAIPPSHRFHELLTAVFAQVTDFHLPTMVIGITSMAMLIALKRWNPLFPAALLVVVLATLVVWLFDLQALGVDIIGAVPAGLPLPSLPDADSDAVFSLLPSALALAFVGYMESVSVAKAFARRNRYDINASQELVGLGLANIAGSLFRAFPVAGGLSRTAVNAQAGARTGMAAIITALVIMVVAGFLTPLFHYLPRAVLAAVIMTAVASLIDVREVRRLYRIKRSDLGLLILTFAATLTLGIQEGILTGVVASIVWFVVTTTRPHSAILGRLPGTTVYRNVKRHPHAQTQPGIVIIRIDAQFYFGSANFMKECMQHLVNDCEQAPHTLIIDAGSVTQLDSSADAALHDLVEDLRIRGIELYIAEAIGPVLDVMRRSGLIARLGEEHVTYTVHESVERALARQAQETTAG